jgi:hypothetical protein
MTQRGQVFELKGAAADGRPVWAYRYRVGGRGSRRVQRGGFESEQAAAEALARALARLRREQGLVEAPKLRELVDVYLAPHDGEPETVEKLRWLLAKAVRSFGHRRISHLRPAEIAAWRMTIPAGHRFEATQALRQVLARAVSWGLIDSNPAKQGVDNPQRRRTEKRPFESWAELEALATELGPRYGPLVLFAAATGLRPGGIALEHRDLERDARVVYVRRAYRNGWVKWPKTERALAPCLCRRSRSLRSSECRRTDGRRWYFRHLWAVTSICTTSATATGGPPSSQPASRHFGVSTISGTRLPPSLSVPASPPSSSRATREQASE